MQKQNIVFEFCLLYYWYFLKWHFLFFFTSTTAFDRPWLLQPHAPSSISSGFSTLLKLLNWDFFLWYTVVSLTFNSQPGGPVLLGRVPCLYPEALGTHFSCFVRHAWATLGIVTILSHPVTTRVKIAFITKLIEV